MSAIGWGLGSPSRTRPLLDLSFCDREGFPGVLDKARGGDTPGCARCSSTWLCDGFLFEFGDSGRSSAAASRRHSKSEPIIKFTAPMIWMYAGPPITTPNAGPRSRCGQGFPDRKGINPDRE